MIGFVVLAAVVAEIGSTPPAWEPYALAAGAILGAFLRAVLTTGQNPRSRETMQDVIIAGVLGFLWEMGDVSAPIIGIGWPPFHFSPLTPPSGRIVLVFILSYFFIELIKQVLLRWAPAIFEKYAGSLLPKDKEKST